MSTSHQFYRYNQLPQGDVFRYLVLHPGLDGPLECDIHIATMALTQFEAISYVWGEDMSDQMVICDGRVIMITPNLARVLRRMRLPDTPVKLWADSICIDQENYEEKEHQVGLMGKIYREAERVRLCIGPDDDQHGPGVSSLLQEVDQMIQTTWATLDPASWDSFPYPDDDDPILTDQRWQSMYRLLAQSWFDRGWVVQEAALGRHAWVMWGKSVFDWDSLMRTYVWLCTRAASVFYSHQFSEVLLNAHKDVYLETHADFGRHFYHEMSWGTPSILRTLNCAKVLELRDPRDRIYAFMGLPQCIGKLVTPSPDYQTSFLDTYRDFAKQYVDSTRSTDILESVSHDDESYLSAPSWVPRWDISTWSLAQRTISPAPSMPRTPSTIEPVVTEDWRLKVRGVIFDTVHFVSDLYDWDTITVETITDLWSRIRLFPMDYHYVVRNSADGVQGLYQLDAFLEALSAGTYDGTHSEWQQARTSFISEAQLATSGSRYSPKTVAAGEDDFDANLFFEHVRNGMHNRRFVFTTTGYMGLGPRPVRVGDTCGFIFGCKTPCILRETAQKGMAIRIVSNTYVLSGYLPLAETGSSDIDSYRPLYIHRRDYSHEQTW
jgi:hypothetical protein